MKKLLGIVVLGLFLGFKVYADNISDFQIKGMSLGDSALKYYLFLVTKTMFCICCTICFATLTAYTVV